ncbi:TauD/TfdA family dioxygenase [Ramlibacter rhizophilus]|uniref:TauD/TfdA family dioxygenase n=1 Tax=Ramlibacter rhizophilus TaxID=1781167 RepID=UPI0014325C80|nr:TauD/TfdA family dioxygenase [Ramlibacter rhizophilus]
MTGPAAWTAEDMRRDPRWVVPLTEAEQAELRAAAAGLAGRGPGLAFGAREFPLPLLGPRLARMREELEDGRGVVLLRGVPVEGWDLPTVEQVYWGIGAHLGTALAQTPRGELLVRVEDRGGDQYRDPTARGFHTARRLPFHNDQGDVVGLLCVRTSLSGGASCIASAAAVHNEILRTRADLLEVLYGPWWCDIRGEQPPGRPPFYVEPRFSQFNGRLFTQHGRTYIDSAQRFAEVPRLTDAQLEAMTLVDALCASDRFRLDMDFQPGDIQFLNNRVVLHSRTDFVDHEEPGRKRLLLRLWLRTPGYEVLPEYFRPRFEDMDYWLRHPVPQAT